MCRRKSRRIAFLLLRDIELTLSILKSGGIAVAVQRQSS